MYIVDYVHGFEDGEAPANPSSASWIWSGIESEMDDKQTLWIFAPHCVSNRGTTLTPLGLAQSVSDSSDLFLRDIITVHTESTPSGLLDSSYQEILFFVKDNDNYYFDKDAIRVDPVYRGEEWHGHRENGRSSYRGEFTKRYNPEGKDPGNVWLSEIRTETDSKVLDRTEPLPREEAVRRCVRAGSEEGDKVAGLWIEDSITEAVRDESRIPTDLSKTINTRQI